MFQVITVFFGSIIMGRQFEDLGSCLEEISRLDAMFPNETHYYVYNGGAL